MQPGKKARLLPLRCHNVTPLEKLDYLLNEGFKSATRRVSIFMVATTIRFVNSHDKIYSNLT